MGPGIDDPVVLADQFFTGVTTDVAEAVVGILDGAGRIGDADDGVLVQGKFLIGQFAPAMPAP